MKSNKLKLVLLLILMFVLNTKPYCQNKDHYRIDSVKYYAMLDGYCAITALQMNLDYYGLTMNQSLLLNLGWNYGIMYFKTPYYTIAYPDTDPVEEIVFACNLIGFNATVIVHKSLKEAKETLNKYISQDIPVIIQWIPHTVLAYGYKDSANIIIYQDPGNFRNQIIDDIDKIQFGKGEEASMPISEWEKMPYLWGMRQYQMVIIESKGKNIQINWKDIWKRNAEKTFGTIKNTFPAYYGIEIINEMIKDIKTLINQDMTKANKVVNNYAMFLKLGTGFRRDASSFLAGQASVLNDKFRSCIHRVYEISTIFSQGL